MLISLRTHGLLLAAAELPHTPMRSDREKPDISGLSVFLEASALHTDGGGAIVDAVKDADDPVADDPHADETTCATTDDIRQAIESLTTEETSRLRRAARYCLFGTAYSDPHELINEAVKRAMNAAMGQKGRKWPKSVPFLAFMIKTMQGLADDSLNSSGQRLTVSVEDMTLEGSTADEALAAVRGYDHHHKDVVSMAVGAQEAQERHEAAKPDADAIDAYFAGDDGIGYLIMGMKDGMKPAEVREISGMSQTEYDTAKRRFRRGLDKLFPGRRQS
jgi:hypothetical protein